MLHGLIIHKACTQSTNRDMAELIQQCQKEGLYLPDFKTIIADYQISGRGQGANHWHSGAGLNLLATLHFQPTIPAHRQFLFNQYFALAVRKTLLPYCNDVKIKWPNDIYVSDRKIAGILIEHTVMGDTLSHTIAGIGLNVNETDFPEELPNPVSIRQMTGKNHDVGEIANQLITNCMETYPLLQAENGTLLSTAYWEHLYRREMWAEYEIQGVQMEACIVRIDPYGRLILEDRRGEKYTCGMKEVRYLI